MYVYCDIIRANVLEEVCQAPPACLECARWPVISIEREKEFFIDNLLVRIHFIIEMILVDQPCAMGA